MKRKTTICDGAGIGNTPVVSPRAAASTFQGQAEPELERFYDTATEVAICDGVNISDDEDVRRYWHESVRSWNEAIKLAAPFFQVPHILTYDRTLAQIELRLGDTKDPARLDAAIKDQNWLAVSYLYRKATRLLLEATKDMERRQEIDQRRAKEADRSRKCSEAGKKGAKAAKAQRPKDPERDKVVEEVVRKLHERDDLHTGQSANSIFMNVANRNIGENGKPIMSVIAIKKAIQRRKDETRGRHNRNRK